MYGRRRLSRRPIDRPVFEPLPVFCRRSRRRTLSNPTLAKSVNPESRPGVADWQKAALQPESAVVCLAHTVVNGRLIQATPAVNDYLNEWLS